MLRILLVYGTRPEAIKMAPVVQALRRRSERCKVCVCATAQHREILDQVHSHFGLVPDLDLDLMKPGQKLNELASRAFSALEGVLSSEKPDWVLVQGDTTSALVAALAAFHREVRVGHVEAGLRTGDLQRPFPEEGNRRIIDLLATYCFAPTAHARRTLLGEGMPEDRVFLTGNTVVDALQQVSRGFSGKVADGEEVLVTVHRRESFGPVIREIFAALAELASSFPHLRWVFPVHPNPEVRGPAEEFLSGVPNIELYAPFDYLEFLRHLWRCRLVMTDSGGIQEEAPAFGKPVLVLRERTERPEGIHAGVARLVGVNRRSIVSEASRLLEDPAYYQRMTNAKNPYGDGLAGERIASILTGEPWEPFAEDGLPKGRVASARSSR